MEVSVIGGQARLVMYATFTPIATLISCLPLAAHVTSTHCNGNDTYKFNIFNFTAIKIGHASICMHF